MNTVVTRAEPHNQVNKKIKSFVSFPCTSKFCSETSFLIFENFQCVIHPLQDRVLTVRENARIQGFPDFYKLCGTVKEK